MNLGRGVKYFVLTIGIMYIGNLIAPAYFTSFNGNALYLTIGGAILVGLVAAFRKEKIIYMSLGCGKRMDDQGRCRECSPPEMFLYNTKEEYYANHGGM